MARNRVIYQSEALYVSSGIKTTGINDHLQLHRVQSANYNFSIARQDINQYGQLSRIDALILEPPTVSLDFSYYLTDGFNERALGFYVQTGVAASNSGSFISGHMTATSGRNLYILTTPEGYDANRNQQSGVSSLIGLGNSYLSNYSIELAVGAIPTVSATFDCANINAVTNLLTGSGIGFTGYTGFMLPSIEPSNGAITYLTGQIPFATGDSVASTVTALRPGDITLNISEFLNSGITSLDTGDGGMHITSASLSIPLSRSPLQRLGSQFPFAKTVDFPIKSTLSIKAIVNEITSNNLANIIKSTVEKDIKITLKKDDGTTNAIVIDMKGCTLDSESISSSIGSNKSVDITFSTQVGGIKDLTHGVFMSGIGTGQAF